MKKITLMQRKKLRTFNPKIKEECGVFGISDLYPQLTDHYFTGDYPVKPIDDLGDNKITQLSLLSSGQKN